MLLKMYPVFMSDLIVSPPVANAAGAEGEAVRLEGRCRRRNTGCATAGFPACGEQLQSPPPTLRDLRLGL